MGRITGAPEARAGTLFFTPTSRKTIEGFENDGEVFMFSFKYEQKS